MAPVARRVADADQNRLVLVPRPGQCLVAPRVPVHWIAGMLQEVRAPFSRQSVWHGRCSPSHSSRVLYLDRFLRGVVSMSDGDMRYQNQGESARPEAPATLGLALALAAVAAVGIGLAVQQ